MNPLRFFWGLIIVLLGLMLIATNAGWISTGVWWSVLMLWPVILIMLGLKLLLHNNDKLFMWMALVIVLLSAAYVVATNQNKWRVGFMERSRLNLGTSVVSETLTDKYETAITKKLKLSVSTGAATVNIHALPEGTVTDVLYIVKSQDMGKLAINRSLSGDTVVLNVQEERVGFHMNNGMMGLSRQIDISLPSSLLFDLDLSSGASKLDADFSNLKPENVSFSVGASSGEIVFSDKVVKQTFVLDAGASSLTFRIPAGLGLKATLDGGLNNVSIDNSLGLSKSGNTYTSQGFDGATSQLTLTGGVGVSSIKFLRK